MKNLNDILFIVQAREGSTRVKNKMIKPLSNSDNLFSNCLKIVKKSDIPHKQFYASVGETQLINIALKENIQIYERSIKSSQESKNVPLILEWNKLPYKHYIMISACCPFLKPQTINDFILAYRKSESDGMMSVIKKRNVLWKEDKELLNYQQRNDFQTQTLPPYYEAAHCLYAGNMERLKDKGIHLGTFTKLGDPDIFEINEHESFDIDEEWQFQLAFKYFKQF